MQTQTNNNSQSYSNYPLGLRNNNPLNIRVSSNQWQGKVPSDNAFEKFSSLEYGIRAGVINLRTYFNQYGLNTIRGIINKWAPPTENQTSSYVSYVSNTLNISPDTVLPLSADIMSSLFSAMSDIELGKNFGLPKKQILEVINRFGLLV